MVFLRYNKGVSESYQLHGDPHLPGLIITIIPAKMKVNLDELQGGTLVTPLELETTMKKKQTHPNSIHHLRVPSP